MRKINHFFKSSLCCLMLVVCMVVTSVPAYANPGNSEGVSDAFISDTSEVPEPAISDAETPPQDQEEPVVETPEEEPPEVDSPSVGAPEDPLPDATAAPEETPADPEANTTAATCTVRFGNNAGTNIYAGYTLTVAYGTTITLPEVPKTNGYRNRGWSFTAHSEPTHFPGDSYKVTGDVLFRAVRVQQFTVKFNNNSGTTVAPIYDTLTMVVDRDSTVTLPAVPKATGYRNLGWTTVIKSSTVTNEAGSQYTVTGDITFYAVRKKLNQYTVKFTNNSGTNFGSPYDALVKTVYEGTVITLPVVPAASGYRNMGWTTEIHGRSVTNAPESSYKVTKDITFYAYREQIFTITFLSRNGNAMPSVTPLKGIRGEKVILPSMVNPAGQTVVGWDLEMKQRTYPDYDFGETYTIAGNQTLYAVVYNHQAADTLTLNPPTGTYKNVIFVGDSRFDYAERKLGTQITALNNQNSNKINIIGKSSATLNWFTNGMTSASDPRPASEQVLEALRNSNGQRTAVIFNLGANDIGPKKSHDTVVSNMARYKTTMEAFANQVSGMNCDLYYMSVNPINNSMLNKLFPKGDKSRPESYLLEFNSMLKSLNGYIYLDCYRYLTDTGYACDNGSNGIDSGVDDGLHYSAYTYKKIFNYCIEQTNIR